MARLVDELWPERDSRRSVIDDAPSTRWCSLPIVEKETAVAGRAPPDRPRLPQPAAAGHAASGRCHRDLRADRRRAFRSGRRALPRRPLGRTAPTTPTAMAACRPAPSPIQGGSRSPRCLNPAKTTSALFRRRRLRRARLRRDPGRAQPQRRTLARRAGQGEERRKRTGVGGASGISSMTGFARASGGDGASRLELGSQERQRPRRSTSAAVCRRGWSGSIPAVRNAVVGAAQARQRHGGAQALPGAGRCRACASIGRGSTSSIALASDYRGDRGSSRRRASTACWRLRGVIETAEGPEGDAERRRH